MTRYQPVQSRVRLNAGRSTVIGWRINLAGPWLEPVGMPIWVMGAVGFGQARPLPDGTTVLTTWVLR